MLMILRSLICVVILWFCLYDPSVAVNRILVVERPVVEYVNSSFGRLINITSGRYGRHDPLYYIQIYYETYVNVNKHFIAHISVDENLSYSSKRRFIDMDLNICNYISMVVNSNMILYKKNNDDEFTGLQLKSDCELPVGFYYLYNMTWRSPAIPFVVRFSEGRLNIKIYSKDKTFVASAHVDLAMRSVQKKKSKGI